MLSSNLVHRKLQCFRWILVSNDIDTLIKDLNEDRVFTNESIDFVKYSRDKVEALFITIEKSLKNKDGVLQFFDIEFEVMPQMSGKATIITDSRTITLQRDE